MAQHQGDIRIENAAAAPQPAPLGRRPGHADPRAPLALPPLQRHRAADGSLELTLREEAQALHTSATQNIPATEQIPTVRTIENRLRDVYRKLRRSGRGTHE